MLKVKPKSYKQKIEVSTWNQNGLLSNILEDSNRKFQMVTGLILKLYINPQWYLSFECFFSVFIFSPLEPSWPKRVPKSKRNI